MLQAPVPLTACASTFPSHSIEARSVADVAMLISVPISRLRFLESPSAYISPLATASGFGRRRRTSLAESSGARLDLGLACRELRRASLAAADCRWLARGDNTGKR